MNSPSSSSTKQQQQGVAGVAENRNEITIDNSVLVLIDHQPWVAFSVKSIDVGLLVNNLAGLPSSAQALDVPVILTTVGAQGGALKDPRSGASPTSSQT